MMRLFLPESYEDIKAKWIFILGLLFFMFFFFLAAVGIMLESGGAPSRDVPFLPPSGKHPLGTDDLGYDVLDLLVRSTPTSLMVGLLGALFSVFIGTAVGMAAGYVRGVWGEVFSGFIDVVLLVPMLPFMVLLTAYLGPGIGNMVLAIACLGWCATARAVRAKVLQLRENLFVEALECLGYSQTRILWAHLLPNVSDVVSARFVLSVAGAMLSEAALSFMGLGDPVRPSWGKMMHFAFHRGGFVNGLWHWYLPPGLCITACTLGFVLLGLSWEKAAQKDVSLDQWIR
ncbi:ABC transporter permease [Desulfosoma sp.]